VVDAEHTPRGGREIAISAQLARSRSQSHRLGFAPYNLRRLGEDVVAARHTFLVAAQAAEEEHLELHPALRAFAVPEQIGGYRQGSKRPATFRGPARDILRLPMGTLLVISEIR
jgi:hypothetical protein